MNKQTSIYDSLKQWFPDPSATGALTLPRFASVEAALHLLFLSDPEADPYRANLLFTRFQLIGMEHASDLDVMLLSVDRTLQRYRSQQCWVEDLDAYRSSAYDALRVFVIEDTPDGTRFHPGSNALLPYEDRLNEWKRHWGQPPATRNPMPAIQSGTPFSFSLFQDNSMETVSLTIYGPIPEPAEEPREEKGPRPPIFIPLSELLECARAMKEMDPSDYALEVLESNTLKAVREGVVEDCAVFTLQQVTNLIGMVGSGKTTLIRVLAFWAHRHGKRIVIILNTVADVLSLWKNLKGFGVSCSPLIGRTSRARYLDQVWDPSDRILNPELSSLLAPCCALDGLRENRPTPIPPGKEPCWSLTQGSKTCICPWFDRCPGTRMYRECYTASVVLTTPAGLPDIRVGRTRELFLELCLREMDLVIFDECDRVQHTLDEKFMPTASMAAYISAIADEHCAFLKTSGLKQYQERAMFKFHMVYKNCNTVRHCLHDAIQANPDFKKSDGRILIARQLLNDLREGIGDDPPLPEPVYQSLLNLTSERTASLEPASRKVRDASCYDASSDEFFLSEYEEWRDSLQDIFPRPEDTAVRDRQDKALKTVLCVIYFEKFIRDLETAFLNSHDLVANDQELIRLAGFRSSTVRTLLPSAPAGNLLGTFANNSDRDVILFRQYGVGRALMKDAPWLRLDAQGNPAGPHVLLMSGSSWASGSFEYHVNRPVNYILEASSQVRAFLDRTEIFLPENELRVSGSSQKQRSSRLAELTNTYASQILDECQGDGKVLLVVNSYKECETVANALAKALSGTSLPGICVLYPDNADLPDDKEETFVNTGRRHCPLHRGEVSRFAQMPEKILIAPALAIERGHNIVDESGHSSLSAVFFLARPMSVPDDPGQKGCKLIGYVESLHRRQEGETAFAFQKRVRESATKFWLRINTRRLSLGLDSLPKEEQRDIIASLFILILQIFGRLARVRDSDRQPPHIYFADAAFRRSSKNRSGFDCLNEMEAYLDNLMNDTATARIARSLYEPFWKALKRSLHYDEI